MAPTVSVSLAACAPGEAACVCACGINGKVAPAAIAAPAAARVKILRREIVGACCGTSLRSEEREAAIMELLSFHICTGGGCRDPHVDMVERSAVDIVTYLSCALITTIPLDRRADHAL